MLFELRQYQCMSGKRDEFADYMDETLIPFQVSQGVVVVASFIDEEDPDGYVWIRRFDSRGERDRICKTMYATETWNKEVLPAVLEMVHRERSVISQLRPTPKSVIR